MLLTLSLFKDQLYLVREVSHNFVASLSAGEGWECFYFVGREKGLRFFLHVSLGQPHSLCVIFFFNFLKEKKKMLIFINCTYSFFFI